MNNQCQSRLDALDKTFDCQLFADHQSNGISDHRHIVRDGVMITWMPVAEVKR